MKSLSLPLIALSGLLFAGCAGEIDEADDVVLGSVEAPLSSGAVRWVNGTYSNCIGRTGGWSARASGSDPMDNAALSVVRNDSSCVLTLTSVVADVAYAASPTLTLGTSYAGTPSTFGVGGTAFSGNAKLETNVYANDFQITFLYGGGDQTPPLANFVVSGGYTTYTTASSTTLFGVAPNYTIDLSGLRFQSTLLLFVGVTGQAQLTDGSLIGSVYAIDSTLGALATYGQVDSAFNAAASTQKTITGANPTIQASEFNVVATTILGSVQTRNLIIKRVNGAHTGYQIFRIKFTT